MNKLDFTLDSREVAAMIEKEHRKLLRDIRTYIDQMEEVNKKAFEEGRGAETKIGLGDFFKESSYLDANNQSRPCYQVTRKGCEFIANKLTGVKGTEFTARYINRFHEMESALEGEKDIYKIKNTSLGEITSFVREMDTNPSDIAEAFKEVCGQFGIKLPDNFVREPRVWDTSFLTLEEVLASADEDE